jgi:hypothetical protein
LLWSWSANHPLCLPLQYEDPAPPTIPSLSFCLIPSPLHSFLLSGCHDHHESSWVCVQHTRAALQGTYITQTQPQLAYPVTCSFPMSLNCVFPSPCPYSQAAHRESGWEDLDCGETLISTLMSLHNLEPQELWSPYCYTLMPLHIRRLLNQTFASICA